MKLIGSGYSLWLKETNIMGIDPRFFDIEKTETFYTVTALSRTIVLSDLEVEKYSLKNIKPSLLISRPTKGYTHWIPLSVIPKGNILYSSILAEVLLGERFVGKEFRLHDFHAQLAKKVPKYRVMDLLKMLSGK